MNYVIVGWLLLVQSWTFGGDLFSYIYGGSNGPPEDTESYTCEEIITMVRGRVRPMKNDSIGKLNKSLHVFDGGRLQSEFYYYIPTSYARTKPLPVLIYLHGRVTHALPGQGKAAFVRWQQWCESNGYLLILPSGQREFPWWSALGEAHVLESFRYIAERYCIDYGRVFLSGVSDGASATYIMGMRYTDRFAAGVSWLGSLQVNREPNLGNSSFYVGNCKAMPWRVVTGGRDKIYPIRSQRSTINHLQASGVNLTWKNYKQLKHSEPGAFELDAAHLAKWLAPIERSTAPIKLDWSVSNPTRYGQHHWIQVRQLTDKNHTSISEQSVLPRMNKPAKSQNDLGVHFIDGDGQGLRVSWCEPGSVGASIGLHPYDIVVRVNEVELNSIQSWQEYWQKNQKGELMVRRTDAVLRLPVVNRPIAGSAETAVIGRIVAKRSANRIDIQCQNIAAVDVLVSPDLFDLSKELVVVVNDREYYRGRVTPDRHFLLAQLRKRYGDHSVVYVNRIAIQFDPFLVQ